MTISVATAAPFSRAQALEMYQQLSPAERQQALQYLQQQQGGVQRQAPLSQPQVVTPAPAGEPDVESQADRADEAGARPDREGATAERLSPIEQRLNRATGPASLEVLSSPRSVTQTLRQFGYDLFEGAPTTFAPATDIPVPVDYVIGPGDIVEVQLFGKENVQYSLVVTREGMLNFPSLGPISVAGLSFAELKADLSQRINNQMIGVQASITMGPLRSIRVFVMGDVRRPGSYTVSSLSTVTNALFVSGGVRPIGSLRDIQLKRAGKIVTEIDLYDLLLRGDTRADARLQPGDVIFVPPIGETVGVAGEVRRPAIYELDGEASVADVLNLAGGMLSSARPDAAQLERVAPTGGRTLVDLDLSGNQGLRTAVRDGDVVRVYSAAERLDNIVLLDGHVQHPGGYQWRAGMRLSDLISSLELLLPAPDLDYVAIVREIGPERRVQVRSARLGQALARPGTEDDPVLEARDYIIVFSLGGQSPWHQAETSEVGRQSDERGAVAMPAGGTVRAGKDTELSDRQRLLAPIIERLRQQARHNHPQQVVTVRGEVAFPGEYPLEPDMTVDDLIRAAGGYKQSAYVDHAELTRFDATGAARITRIVQLDLAAGDSPALRPFDVLHIKPLPEWAEQQTVELAGEVRFPGTYTIRQGETLRDVIERAGGLSEGAYPYGAVFSRKSLREREQQELVRMRQRLQADIASASLGELQVDPSAQQAAATGQQLLAQIETSEAIGRMVIDLPKVLAGRDRVELRAGDRLHIPKKPQAVTVVGEVHQTTSHLYDEQLNRNDYIQLSGGLTSRADKGAIYVVRANGAVIASDRSLWFSRGSQSIQPGDTIVVPLDIDRMKPLTLWSTIADIAQKFALTVASAKAVGVF